MSGSTTKKVVLARFEREPLRGYVNPQSWLQQGFVELLSPAGAVSSVPLDQVKAVCFVRDLSGPAIFSERLEFRARPKSAGLWVELRYRDGDRLEGLLPNNLLAVEDGGVSVTPPDLSGNSQRVYTPRSALESITVIGVIGVPRHRRVRDEDRQIKLF